MAYVAGILRLPELANLLFGDGAPLTMWQRSYVPNDLRSSRRFFNRFAQIIDPTEFIIFNNAIKVIEIFFQLGIPLKQFRGFQWCDEELGPFLPQSLHLLNGFGTISGIAHSAILDRNIDSPRRTIAGAPADNCFAWVSSRGNGIWSSSDESLIFTERFARMVVC